VIVKLPLDKAKKPCYAIAKFRKRGKIMKACLQINSIRESEVLSEYIESQFIKSDLRKRKQSMQAKQIKHVQAVLSNNNNNNQKMEA
jgi:hypothetical protein